MGKVKAHMMELDEKVSHSMVGALEWLANRGGSGVIDRYGHVVATGDVCKRYDPSTFLRLVAIDFLEGVNQELPRLHITQAGKAFLERNGYDYGRDNS